MNIMDDDSLNFYKHEKAVGTMYFAQLYMELCIEDTSNTMSKRMYAMEIHKWLGTIKITIDCIFDKSYNYGIFILDAMEKYQITSEKDSNSNLITTMDDVKKSLEYQKDLHIEREMLLCKMTIAAITDIGYRGYD